MRSFPLLAALLALAPASASGLTPHLVKDINTIPKPTHSSPARFLTTGGVTYFVADDGDTGRELWRTDGTLSGTYRLTDACTGECSSQPVIFASTDRSVFFLAEPEPGIGSDLWVSRGTPATTIRLTGAPLVFLSPENGFQRRWVASQRILYFAADDGIHGVELWRSDGTPAGTHLVSDLWPGPQGSRPRELTEFKSRLYFNAHDAKRGPLLWTSDGTPQGTQAVSDPLPASASHPGPASLRVVGNALYFVAPAPGRGTELWKSDGTTRGTALLADLVRGAGSPVFHDFTTAGNRLYFVAATGSNGQELWTTDGTARGTKALTSFPQANAFIFNLLLPRAALGSRIVFAANDGPHGIELWVSDGTAAGTRLLRDICPGACWGGFPGVVIGNRVFFTGQTSARGFELWTTDGTPEGTRIVRDICRGSCSSNPYATFDVGGKLFFLAQDQVDGDEDLWRTDGTAPGTVRLTDFNESEGIGSFAGEALPGAALGNLLLFAARDGEHGIELWHSDGTADGTRLLSDINARDLGGSDPINLRTLGNSILFFANDGVHGVELWKSDGTAGGTALVHEFIPGPDPRFGPRFPISSDQAAGKLFFFFSVDDGDSAVWRTDGTDVGTVRLTAGDVRPFSEIRAVGDTVFFGGSDEEHGSELWKTDGTAAGTVLVKDIRPGDFGSGPLGFVPFQGRLYFTASGPEHRGLWVSDGTEAGTVLVKNLNPFFGSEPEALTEHAGRLWFLADGWQGRRELWSSDGTPAGTVLAAELPPGPDSWSLTGMASAGARLFVYGIDARLWVTDGTAAGLRRISSLSKFFGYRPVALGGKLFFAGSYGSFISVLWQSDGTDAGTVPILDRNGQPIVSPVVLQTFEDRVVFETASGELWQTDGTVEGTIMIREVGVTGFPELVPAGHRLFFRSYDRNTGTELWALEP
jgi:ELWxxDGT repeat protein